MKFHPSTDIDHVIALLESAHLPTADITPELLTRFVGAHKANSLAGVIGFETHGRAGLLRSLVVAPSGRGLGLGALLVEHIETLARKAKIEQLYLLTTDADAYFAKLGYKAVNRSNVPEAIQATSQFSSLCPGTATVMVKAL